MGISKRYLKELRESIERKGRHIELLRSQLTGVVGENVALKRKLQKEEEEVAALKAKLAAFEDMDKRLN